MPLAALIARARFDVGQHISLGHYTHEKNPLACAAGLAVLDVIEKEQRLQRSLRLGNATTAYLERAQASARTDATATLDRLLHHAVTLNIRATRTG